MKKIGLITFHDTANHGAALQAYATLSKVNSLGYNIELIDYSNEMRRSLYNFDKKIMSEIKNRQFLSIIKSVLGARTIIKRMNSFDEFYSEYTPRSSKKFNENDSLKSLNQEYDLFISGSDQIWSTTNNGNDSTYYLDFVDDKRKTISYASSFGSTTNKNNELEPFNTLLRSINYVGVREKQGVEIYNKLTGKTAQLVLDPVFLLESEQWKELVYPYIRLRDSTLVDYTSNKKFIKKFLSIPGVEEKFSYKVKFGTGLSIKDLIDPKTELNLSCGPRDFISAVYYSDYLFTSSFHGVVLAIIFRKQFTVALSGNEGRDSRLISLLEQLGLQDRILTGNSSLETVTKEINYEIVHEKLSTLREQSIAFLEGSLFEALNGCENV